MFIIDIIITDRHNGNWGILVRAGSAKAKFAPIYDCGSCLNPMLDDNEIKEISESELKNIAIKSYSCVTENGKKINYMSYIKNMKNFGCNKAILKLFDKIDLNEIFKFIDSIDFMNIVRKEFYKRIIKIRYMVIEDVYKKVAYQS